MYKVLSVCLTLSFLFGEITTIKTAKKEILSVNELELKKPKPNDEIEQLGTHSRSDIKVNDSEQVQKRIKKYKKNKPGHKDAEELSATRKREVENLESDIVSSKNYNVPLAQDIKTRDEIILREKQANFKGEQAPLKQLNYIQGPKSLKKHIQPTLMSREHEGLFISEYAEGSEGNNKYIEIYNGSDVSVDLSEYYMMQNSNGGPWDEYVDQLTGTLASGDVYVIANSGSNDGILAEADLLGSGICFFNGDDARALVKIIGTDTTIIDYIGDFPDDPGSGWSVGGVDNATANQTLVRKGYVQSGNAGDWVNSAGTTLEDSEWFIADAPTNDYTPPTIGSHEMDMEEEGVYFTEDFEGAFPPEGWVLTGDTYSSYYGGSYDALWAQDAGNDYGPGFAASGDSCAYFNVYDYWYDLVGDMITSEIDLTSATAPQLSFQYWDASGSDYLDVQISDSDSTYTSLGTITSTVGWENQIYDLSSYVGQVIKLRFVAESDYGSSNPHIDDISVAEPPTYPIANVSTGTIDFGAVFVSSSKDANFAVINTGGDILTGAATTTNTNFAVSRFPLDGIAPGDTAVLVATYSPSADQSDLGYIILTHNADSSPDSIMVSGSGTFDILSESFEDPWVGVPAAPSSGWSQITVAGGAPWAQYTSSFYAVSGVNSARAPASSSNSATSPSDHLLISPALDLTDGYRLKFWMDGSSGSSTYYTNVEIQISSQNTDATTGWTDLARYIQYDATGEGGQPQPFSHTEQVIDLSEFTGVNYIGFRVIDAWGSSVYIDDVRVEPIPARPALEFSSNAILFPPTFVSAAAQGSVNVNNVGSVSGTVAITSNNSKFVPSTSSVVIEPNVPVDVTVVYTPTDVVSDTGYVIFTHTGDSSPDSLMVFGSGSLNLLTEGFDGPWTGDPAAPAGWTVVNSGDDFYTWRQGNTYIPEVNGYAAYGSGNQDDRLISPLLNIDGGYNLKWWDVVESSSYNNTYDVYVFPAGDTTAGVNVGTYNCTNTDLTQYSINLSAYDGQSISIGFHQTYSYSSGWGFGIEDVTVEPLPTTPIISVSENSLGFMATAIDSSDSKNIILYNTGSGDLEGTIIYTDGFTGPATFGASDDTISISFSPSASGIFSGSATVSSNGGEDIVISLSGNAGTSVATWDFDADGDGEGDWPVGWETAQEAQIDGYGYPYTVGPGWEFYGGGGHTGDGYASADAGGFGTVNKDFLISPKYSVSTGDVFSFYASDDNSFGSTFYPDIMTVHVSPTGGMNIEDFTVELDSVYNMGPDWVPYSYDLTDYIGTEIRLAIVYRGEYGYALNFDDAAGPEIVLETGPVIYDYTSSLVYSQVNVGQTDTLLFDYFNNGGSDLEVTAVSFDGPFSLSSAVTLPIVTTPGSIGSFDVVFSPTEDSLYSGLMTVTNNSGDVSIPLVGVGFGGVYYEDFGSLGTDGLEPWSVGWTVSDDGVMASADSTFSNGTGNYWRRTYFTSTGDPMMYHTYALSADADTAFSGPITLPVVEGEHYELDTYEYMYFGSYAELSGIAVSSDSGATFTLIGEADYSASGWYDNNYDLTGYSGQTIHLALVYQGTDANTWGVSELAIRSKPDPVIPIFARSKPIFPATAIGDSSSKMVYFANIGAGNLSADITYPASISGPASITDLAPGVQDSMLLTYTPTVSGIETGTIVVDGSGSGAAISSIPFDANAGKLAFDLESQSAGWRSFSLAGEPWISPAGSLISDTWRWYGGAGHSGPNFYGVYSYAPYWGGVDDYLVSPKFSLSDVAEAVSFFVQGGYGDGSLPDSLNVWVSTEMPVMGFEETLNAQGMLVRSDTGFVNTSAFTLAHDSEPSSFSSTWDPVNIDLSNYSNDAWVIIQSVQNYNAAGVQTGWRLKVDDLATPDIYISQEPILNAVARYNFGITSPAGDTVNLGIINSGVEDLIIDSLELANGSAYNLDLVDAEFPVTVMQDSIVRFPVVFAPYDDGPAMDTLIYYSNYTVGNMDANGYGTSTTILSGIALNAPPQPVMLLTPDNNAVLTIDSENADGETGIFWTNSMDPDGNDIEYVLELVFENTGDTLDTALSVTNFFLSHTEALEYMVDVGVTQLEVTWNVFAEDGFTYSPSSNGPFSLVIDGGWALSVDNNNIPEVFALHNNYPNPFNPVTNIGYDIPELSKVTIDIYNIAGNKVKTLVSKEHQPGRYKIQWNATNEFGAPVATGMYIYKIRAKDFVSVKKLLLMK